MSLYLPCLQPAVTRPCRAMRQSPMLPAMGTYRAASDATPLHTLLLHPHLVPAHTQLRGFLQLVEHAPLRRRSQGYPQHLGHRATQVIDVVGGPAWCMRLMRGWGTRQASACRPLDEAHEGGLALAWRHRMLNC